MNAGTTQPSSGSLSNADKHKSATCAPPGSTDGSHGHLGFGIDSNGGGFGRACAKSIPASRRTSQSEHDEDLANHLSKLAVAGMPIGGMGVENGNLSPLARTSPQTMRSNGAAYPGGGMHLGNGNGYNAGMLLDEQLDKEMHSTCRTIS